METRHRTHPIILAHAREMRHPLTPAEATLWPALRNRQSGFKFRRQHLQPEQEEYDLARTKFREELGYKATRFTNEDVKCNVHAVVGDILRIVESRIAELKIAK